MQNKPAFITVFFIIILIGLAGLITWRTSQAQSAGFECPVTRRQGNEFIPPEPFRSYGPQTMFWHGTPELWTAVPTNGAWEMLPRREKGYGNKLAFWSVHFDVEVEEQPDLQVSARRLDAPGTSETDHPATNAYTPEDNWFMIQGVSLPDAGCWEITGTYRDAAVSYVVEVRP